jgi:hypothetical protein
MRSKSISLAAESTGAGDRCHSIIGGLRLAPGGIWAGFLAVLSLRSDDRSLPGHNGHVIIDINGQFYDSGRRNGPWGGGAGVMRVNRPGASYLSSFDRILQPQGL